MPPADARQQASLRQHGRAGERAEGGPGRLLTFRLVVIADWSAASDRGPARPAPDRCWVAWGRPTGARPAPRYFRTRREAETFIRDLLVRCPGPALVGFDFVFGYPAGCGLPAGRALCERLAALITDEADGRNNRFAVAGLLNREIQAACGARFRGPFWGHPPGRRFPHLSPTRPRPFPDRYVSDGRLAERRLAARRIQSPWKLFTRASVGSQTLMGLPAVNRLLTDPALAPRACLWPFETEWERAIGRDAIVIAEMWPSLVDCRDQPYPIKDARQVAAARDWALDQPHALAQSLARPHDLTDEEERACREVEGWIVGPWGLGSGLTFRHF